MKDLTNKEVRSQQMAKVRNKDTQPEMIVRRLVFHQGFRYRLHQKDLPGKPDLVFLGRRKIIFVHGCFWHRHSECKLARLPKTRRDYWVPKLEGNKERDTRNIATLQARGWSVLVVWECELNNLEFVRDKIVTFLR